MNDSVEEDDINMLHFASNNDQTGQDKARMICPSKDGHLSLIGESILHVEDFHFNYDGHWVDLARELIDIQPQLCELIIIFDKNKNKYLIRDES